MKKGGEVKSWETEEGLRSIADFCKKHLPCRQGILNGKRVEYFKGDRLLNVLQGIDPPVKERKRPKDDEEEEEAEDKGKELTEEEKAEKELRKKEREEQRERDEKDEKERIEEEEKLRKQAAERREKDKMKPKIKDEKEAMLVCKALLEHEFFVRSSKDREIKGNLVMWRGPPSYEAKGFYTWVYEGSKTFSNMLTAVIIVGFLLIVCFPIWPMFLKVWMWYLSVTLLIFMLGFLLIRAVVWFSLWMVGYEFWILPNLFDESLAFAESFVPLYGFEKGPQGQVKFRVGAIFAVIYFFYWAHTQPNDFDNFMTAQRDFLTDLYEGNLLADVSQESKENIDKPKGPKSLDDILKELDEEEEVDEEEQTESVIDSLLDDLFEDDEEEDREADRLDAEAAAAAGEETAKGEL